MHKGFSLWSHPKSLSTNIGRVVSPASIEVSFGTQCYQRSAISLTNLTLGGSRLSMWCCNVLTEVLSALQPQEDNSYLSCGMFCQSSSTVMLEPTLPITSVCFELYALQNWMYVICKYTSCMCVVIAVQWECFKTSMRHTVKCMDHTGAIAQCLIYHLVYDTLMYEIVKLFLSKICSSSLKTYILIYQAYCLKSTFYVYSHNVYLHHTLVSVSV